MTTICEILEELEQNGSRLVKREILERNSDNELLQRVIVAALNPYVHYNIRKFTMPKPIDDGGDYSDVRLADFLNDTLKKLSDRVVTGNAAKELVQTVMANMNELEQKWCKRILIQNLRAGIQTTPNKVWPGLVPGFEVQLAKSLDTSHVDDSIVINDPVDYPVRVEPKLDGLRCVAVKENGVVTMYTRNGRVIDTLPTIKALIEKCVVFDNVVFDGEAIGKDWNQSASIIGSKKTKKDDSCMIFNVFDSMPLNDWVSQECNLKMSERGAVVKALVVSIASKKVQYVPSVVCNNEEELMAYYEKCIDEDFEGVMVKSLDGLYTFKRTNAMLKMKPVMTHELFIIGSYNGRDGTKRQNQFGGFEAMGTNGVITRVGGGFSDVLRAEFQIDKASYIGKIIECECQPDPSTKNGLTHDGKLRFPVFVRFRDESDVDPKLVKYRDKELLQ